MMSEQIIATTYTDPAVNAIRTQVAANDDGIPYLLLPVKIETRFMRVDRPVSKPDRFGEILTDLTNLDAYIKVSPTKLPLQEVSGRYNKIVAMAKSVEVKAGTIESLDANSKGTLLAKINLLIQGNQSLGAATAKIPSLDAANIIKLRAFRNDADTSLKTTLSIITKLQTPTPGADTFLRPLQAIVTALTNLAGNSIVSATTRLEKRQAFTFIDEQQATITARMKDMQQVIASNTEVTAAQIKQLSALAAQLQPLGKKTLASLKKLPSKYMSAAYITLQEDILKKLDALQQQIETRFKPKLQVMQEIQKINASTLLTEINNFHSVVQTSNKTAFKTYDEVIAKRKIVYKHLNTLVTDSEKVIVGTEDDLSIIKKSWDAADTALAKLVASIGNFATATEAQKTELNKTVEQVNNVYRKQLSNMKSKKTTTVVRLNNKNLDKAITAYQSSMQKMEDLNSKIQKTKKPSASLTKNAEDFHHYVTEVFPYLRFLPRHAHTNLVKASEQLQKNMSRLKKKSAPKKSGAKKSASKAAPKPGATDKVHELLQLSQKTGIAAAKKKVTVVERPPLVLATPTITRDELWVRIYPDDIAVHTHEALLTQAEVDAGKAYWLEIWSAGDDADLKLAAWRAITASFGSQRAAWIVRTMEPKATSIPVKDTLLENAKAWAAINKLLDQLYTILNKPVALNTMNATLGDASPVLKNALAGLNKIQQQDEASLLKLQQKLLQLQSLLQQYVKATQKITANPTGTTAQLLQSLKELLQTFNSLTQKFQTIDKKTANEIAGSVNTATTFPDVQVKDSSWTQVPHSRVMPDKFVVITIRDGVYRHIQVTETIPANIAVGIHPSMMSDGAFTYDEDKNLIVDDAIKWLTDFNAAVAKGMALYIALEDGDVANGFDKVFVLGVKSTNAIDTQKLVEDLIDNHHYIPEGASFLPIGTATNNTESGSAGYRKIEEDDALSFAVERNNELPVTTTLDPAFPTDGERLANSLGINSTILQNLDYSNRTEISEALIVNKALSPGTIANFMEEALDSVFNRDNIQRTQDFFNNYVTARGFLPSLRTGTQPYGILPVSALSRFSITANDANIPLLTKEDFDHPATIQTELQTRFEIRLKQLLTLLDTLWTDIRNNKVKYAGNTDPADPQAHFMTMLGLDAVSDEYFYRYGVNVASRQGNEAININFDSNDPWSPAKVADTFGSQVFSGYFFKSDEFPDEQSPVADPTQQAVAKWNRINQQFGKARVFTMRALQDQSQILGDKIDNTTLSDVINPAPDPNAGSAEDQLEARKQLPYFIDWLLDQNPWDVHAENKFATAGNSGVTDGMPSKSLLFMLLRHAVLSSYAETILKILEFEGLTDQVTIKKMGSAGYYYQRFAASFSYVTKWTYLFSKIAKLDGVLGFKMETTNPFFIYMNNLGGSSNGFLNRYISPESTGLFNGYVNHAQHQPFMDALNDTKNAVRKLKDIPTLRLEALLREHLDLCTYRLDAWRLGLVNKRLKDNRATKANGIFLGAYGWVEDLRKGGERTPAQNIPPELFQTADEPVFTDADNLGFIHTPSLNHAVTAAILRAGFHANQATDEVDNLLAVNLSSERVRMALNLLNGIRSGQETGALLGYQFERGLHERYLHIPLELDEYIYDFRDEFPLTLPVDVTVAPEEVSLTQVVNGLELLETAQEFVESKGGPVNAGDNLYQSLKSFEADWWTSLGNSNISSASAAKRDAMLKEIDRMADAFDALGDLCVSESIYQVTKGNYVRSSSIMDKLAKGDVPFEIEFADTPRTGTIITHKAGLFIETIEGIDQPLAASGAGSIPISGAALTTAINNADARPNLWNADFTPGALAEPGLNKWVGSMIGDPSKIKCLVQYAIENTTVSATVTIADLAVQALDVLHLFGTGPLDGGAALNARVAAYARKNATLPADFTGTADDLVIDIQYTARDVGWSDDDYSFYEKAGYIQSIRELITNSGALAADALLIPGIEEVPDAEVRNFQPDELHIRVSNLAARLQIVLNAFNDFFNNQLSLQNATGHVFTNPEIDSLRSLLNEAAAFTVPGTLPDTVVSYSDVVGMALINAADGAAKAISARLDQANPDIATGANTTLAPEVRVNALGEAAKKIMGRAFIVLPHFKLRNATDLQTQNNLDTSKGLLKQASEFAIEEWSQGVARVRQRLAVLDTIEMWADNFGITFPAKKPFQFPFTTASDGSSVDPWLGVEFPAGYVPTEDKLSLVLINADIPLAASDKNVCGILLDEWVEIIPNAAEKTGITFNYDQPDAKAPNTLLLAVTPQQTGSWSWDDLVETLNDTLEMAKNRAVEPEHLEDTVFGQILPALLTEVVPPQLLPDGSDNSADAQDNPLGLQVVTDFGVVNDTYVPEEA
ncbi:MAG: hypothetical protein QM802_04050 [Agriterribacter sp.]